MSKHTNNIVDFGTANIDLFDKNHSDYRALIFYNLMNRQAQKFQASIRFKGDDKNFCLKKQRMLMKTVFFYMNAGVINIPKAVYSNLDVSVKNQIFEKDFVALYKDDPIKVLQISPQRWDENEQILQGVGITAPLHNVGRKNYFTTNKDTAYFKYNDYRESGFMQWLPVIYLMATAETIAKKKLTLLDTKLVKNGANNTNENMTFDQMYDITKSFINLNPSSQPFSPPPKGVQFNVSDLLSDKVAKLEMSQKETILDLLAFIDGNFMMWSKMFGMRTNINAGKKDRSITEDFKSEEIHFKLMSDELRDQAQIFAEQYSEINGVTLEVIDKQQEYLDEINELAIAMSGRMGNDETKNKEYDKQEKDLKAGGKDV